MSVAHDVVHRFTCNTSFHSYLASLLNSLLQQFSRRFMMMTVPNHVGIKAHIVSIKKESKHHHFHIVVVYCKLASPPPPRKMMIPL